MKYYFFAVLLVAPFRMNAQELYVYSDAASNVPAKSVSAKLGAVYAEKKRGDMGYLAQRNRPEAYFGWSKKFMIKTSATFANMFTDDFKFESVSLFGKYRFLSVDDAHKHFRMAAFAGASASKASSQFDEISLVGDKTGAEAGIVATQLIKRLAISSTIGHVQVLNISRFNGTATQVPQQAMNYSLSGGYLLFPRKYESYQQTNFNIYTELLAQQSLDIKKYFIDMAPAVQLIFNSNSKLNIGYRFQVSGNMNRMARSNFLLSFERTFLSAF